MSELAELTGAGRIDVFPGHRLAPLDLLDYGECEKEFEAKHIAFAKVAADGQHPETAEKIITRAMKEVEGGKFTFGTLDFDLECLKTQHLPLLAYLELLRHHPDMTRERAGQLIRECPDPDRAQETILALAGYGKKKTTDPSGGTPPTGQTSSPPSESPGSPTPTSAA